MLEQALVEYACSDPDRTNRVPYARVSGLEERFGSKDPFCVSVRCQCSLMMSESRPTP